MSVDIKELLAFLYQASLPHATGTSNAKTMLDRSTTITFEKGAWSFHDNFFGGEPYGGRAVIHHKEKPVWFMAYYGRVHNTPKDPNDIYDFLRLVLQYTPQDMPLQGPAQFKGEELVCRNKVLGSIKSFSGKEVITDKDTEIYWATYMGGLIDQRTGVGF